jgi:hypothetical protein
VYLIRIRVKNNKVFNFGILMMGLELMQTNLLLVLVLNLTIILIRIMNLIYYYLGAILMSYINSIILKLDLNLI